MEKTITFIGGHDPKTAEISRAFADELGKKIAKKDYILISGGGEGVFKFVVEGYKSSKGNLYRAFLPAKKYMEEVGEKIRLIPDEVIKLDCNYPERSFIMLKNSQRVVALNGSTGSLVEIITAIFDFKLPTAVIRFGRFSEILDFMEPELGKKYIHTCSIDDALNYLDDNHA